jgi:hypothetical protein
MSFATEQVALLQDAYRKVVSGQAVRFGERQLTRADANWISSELDKWMRRANAEQANSTGGTAGVAIADFSECRR